MTPQEFIRKWRRVALNERQTAQEHFIDLCRLLGEQTPVEADPDGVSYAFEKGAARATGGRGWADVWKRGHFAFEYKKRHADLKAALKQLLNYSGALANPPLLVTCDTSQFEITTNWTNLVSTTMSIGLEELADPEKLKVIKSLFADPESLRPVSTRAEVTLAAATRFAELAQTLRNRKYAAESVAHFINQILFCLFADNVQLFEERLFEKFLRQSARSPTTATAMLRGLFAAMARGGLYGLDRVEWFNGNLFQDDRVLPLTANDLKILASVAELNWSEIEPAIFGTLFERGLDPSKRSQLGAHYTDREKIQLIVDATITRPLLAEWSENFERMRDVLNTSAVPSTSPRRQRRASAPLLFAELPTAQSHGKRREVRRGRTDPMASIRQLRDLFLERLRNFRILDPACGSGNFLYVALMALKDIELQVIIDSEILGLERVFPAVGPECVLGLEVNAFAVELARVTVWIGEIQWMRRMGFDFSRNPVLRALSGIVQQDAILDEPTGREPEWPAAEVIIGNPPFLGSKFHMRRLGDAYVVKLRQAYHGRVPPAADLVCYWFEKARAQVAAGNTRRVGLLATKSLANAEPSRRVLDRITGA